MDQGGLFLGVPDQVSVGVAFLTEAANVYETISGIHPLTSRLYGNLAMIHYQNEDLDLAREFGKRAAIICERTLGVDHYETLQQLVRNHYTPLFFLFLFFKIQ